MSINNNKIGAQYQNFAHLLYRQNGKIDSSNKSNGSIAISSYKSYQNASNFNTNGNTKTVPITSFPNGRVTSMLQNSYSNTYIVQNYRIKNNSRHALKEHEISNNSFNRSKSVYRDQEWARNGTSGSRSTASHSSGLPPAIKKSSSISADYGKNDAQNYKEIMNHSKIRSSLNPIPHPKNIENKINQSLKGSSRSNDRAWTLKGNNIPPDFTKKIRPGLSSSNLSNSKQEQPQRPDSKRIKVPTRPPSQTVDAPAVVEDCKSESTVIHVIDENKKQQKDFKCNMKILLKHMKYFEKHLKSTESTEDIDISVHCDVNIFEWLLNYIENQERIDMKDDKIKFYDVVEKNGDAFKIINIKRRKPNFEIGNAISILISSEYLKMAKLVDECLQYFIENINEILRLPIDMS